MKHRKLSHGKKFFQNPMAMELTNMRIRARRKRKITYDCISAIVKGNRVICKEGHAFKHVGNTNKEGLPVHSVLRGMSSSICQKCKDYDGETNE